MRYLFIIAAIAAIAAGTGCGGAAETPQLCSDKPSSEPQDPKTSVGPKAARESNDQAPTASPCMTVDPKTKIQEVDRGAKPIE